MHNSLLKNSSFGQIQQTRRQFVGVDCGKRHYPPLLTARVSVAWSQVPGREGACDDGTSDGAVAGGVDRPAQAVTEAVRERRGVLPGGGCVLGHALSLAAAAGGGCPGAGARLAGQGGRRSIPKGHPLRRCPDPAGAGDGGRLASCPAQRHPAGGPRARSRGAAAGTGGGAEADGTCWGGAVMLALAPHLKIYVHLPPTDLRKSFDGLTGLVRLAFQADPRDGSWFLFVNGQVSVIGGHSRRRRASRRRC